VKPSIIVDVTIRETREPSGAVSIFGLTQKSFGFNGSDTFFKVRRTIYQWVERIRPGAEIIEIEATLSLPMMDDETETEVTFQSPKEENSND
jgi:hypothetical protein